MSEVLFVGKPIEPPWNDSSKNLARDLVSVMTRHVPVLLSRQGMAAPSARARLDPVFGDRPAGFAPSSRDKAKLLARIATGGEPIVHFFFAPNAATSTASRAVVRMRRKKSVHTICSAPKDDVSLAKVLFADVNVVLSRHTERRLLDSGIEPARVVRILPSIPLLPVPTVEERLAMRRELGVPADCFLVVYPGDLEFGRGAQTIIEAVSTIRDEAIRLVVACRTKTPAAKQRDVEMRGLARTLGIEHRVHWAGETRRIHALLGTADVVALPTDTLYAKMDHPLVLLEAMAMERPVITAAGTPSEELAEGGSAMAVDCDIEHVANAILRLREDLGAARAMGRLGRVRVETQHSPEAMGKAYEAIYDALESR